MPKYKDLTGQKFGRLLVVKQIGRDSNQNVVWECLCDCGNVTSAITTVLKRGTKRSCGCLMRESAKIQLEKNAKRITHGGYKERLYTIYAAMIRRCENPHDNRYDKYGGRGIKVCDEWRNDYSAFRSFALENGYDPEGKYGQTTIDRIDVNGNYCPENCRFVSQTVQQNNKSNNTWMTYNGKTLTMAQWAKELGISVNTIMSRINYGWSTERILSEPVHNNGRKKRVDLCAT